MSETMQTAVSGAPAGGNSKCLLWVEGPDGSQEPFEIYEGTFIVGRSANAGLKLSDVYVSRQHLRITRSGDEVTLENLSRFGAKVGDEEVNGIVALESGQAISLTPDTTLRFERIIPEPAIEPCEPEEIGDGEQTRTGLIARPPGSQQAALAPPQVVRPAVSPAAQRSNSLRECAKWLSKGVIQLNALVATLFILVTIRILLPEDAYLRQFLLERSACQWLSLYAFIFGLFCLVRRFGHWTFQSRMLQRLLAGALDTTDGHGTVARRHKRINYYGARLAATDLRGLAKDMAEHDREELRAGYTPVHDVIQMLPLIGFFGTVLGLSLGLYTTFAKAGGSAADNSFATAIATAFDTTLLALACTIAMTILQRLIHRREEHLLNRLDEYVDQWIEDRIPEGKSDLEPEDASSVLPEIANKLHVLSESLIREVGEMTARAMEEHGRLVLDLAEKQKALFEAAMATLDSGLTEIRRDMGECMKDTLATGIERAVEAGTCATRVSNGALVSELRDEFQISNKAVIVTLEEEGAAQLEMLKRIEERLKLLASPEEMERVATVLREGMTEFSQVAERVLRQPRRVSIVELGDVPTT